VLAQRLGLPIAGFVAASNLNDVLPEFLRTGSYRSRPSIATLSNAMDVGDPSNFVRLLSLHGGSTEALRSNVEGLVVSEEETRTTIRDVYRRTEYLLDPHTAVGYAAAMAARKPAAAGAPVVVLATAHPAKFGGVIQAELGFEAALPEAYQGWEKRPILAETLESTDYATFREWLTALPGA